MEDKDILEKISSNKTRVAFTLVGIYIAFTAAILIYNFNKSDYLVTLKNLSNNKEYLISVLKRYEMYKRKDSLIYASIIIDNTVDIKFKSNLKQKSRDTIVVNIVNIPDWKMQLELFSIKLSKYKEIDSNPITQAIIFNLTNDPGISKSIKTLIDSNYSWLFSNFYDEITWEYISKWIAYGSNFTPYVYQKGNSKINILQKRVAISDDLSNLKETIYNDLLLLDKFNFEERLNYYYININDVYLNYQMESQNFNLNLVNAEVPISVYIFVFGIIINILQFYYIYFLQLEKQLEKTQLGKPFYSGFPDYSFSNISISNTNVNYIITHYLHRLFFLIPVALLSMGFYFSYDLQSYMLTPNIFLLIDYKGVSVALIFFSLITLATLLIAVYILIITSIGKDNIMPPIKLYRNIKFGQKYFFHILYAVLIFIFVAKYIFVYNKQLTLGLDLYLYLLNILLLISLWILLQFSIKKKSSFGFYTIMILTIMPCWYAIPMAERVFGWVY